MVNELENKAVKKLIELMCLCYGEHTLYVFDFDINKISALVKKNNIKILNYNDVLKNQVIFLSFDLCDKRKIRTFINNNKENNIIIALSKNFSKRNSFSLSFVKSKNRIRLFAPFMNYKKKNVPKDFKVLAIMHIYNEDDILEDTIKYLLSQGLDIYILNNHSTDCSLDIIKKYIRKYPDRIYYELFPKNGYKNQYEWEKQLKRTEQISKTMDYDWFVLYDADEIRISPFKNVRLLDFIYYVDSLGYTLIDNCVVDFKITDKNSGSIFSKNAYFNFPSVPKEFDFVYLKTWKKAKSINITKYGGHIAIVKTPKIFPIKILNKHYPFRTFEQARKKVFVDRKPRYSAKEKMKKWHIHYDSISKDEDLIFNRKDLYKWTNNTLNDWYIILFFGLGHYLQEKK